MAVNQVVDGGEGLVFVVYPEVVSLMPEVCMKQRTISFKTPLQKNTRSYNHANLLRLLDSAPTLARYQQPFIISLMQMKKRS